MPVFIPWLHWEPSSCFFGRLDESFPQVLDTKRTSPSCPPQPFYKHSSKHFLQLTEYLRSDILTSTPVDLFRFSSWDTTTCSSFVRWQSSSNMSVPILTALEAKKSALNHTCISYRSKRTRYVLFNWTNPTESALDALWCNASSQPYCQARNK